MTRLSFNRWLFWTALHCLLTRVVVCVHRASVKAAHTHPSAGHMMKVWGKMWKYVHQSVYVYICLGMVCAESARWIKECYGKWKRPVREKGQLGWLWHLGSGGNFSNLSVVRLLVTCSQLDLDDFALPSVYSLGNHCPDGASPARIKDRKRSRNQRYSSDIYFYVTNTYGLAIKHAALHWFFKIHETITEYLLSLHMQSEILALPKPSWRFMKLWMNWGALIRKQLQTVHLVED